MTYWNRNSWTEDDSWRFAGFILRMPVGVAAARTWTRSSSTLVLASTTDLSDGYPVRIFSTGNWPGGTRAGVTYYLRLTGGSNATIHTTKAGALANTGQVTLTSAGSGTLSIHPCVEVLIKNGGSDPGASALDNTTITANTDFILEAVGGTGAGITGTNESSVNDAITAGGLKVYEVGAGPVARVVRVVAPFNNGTENSLTGAYHYIFCLQNGSGGLYGFRHRAALYNGWTDGSACTNIAFISAALKDGATTIRTLTTQGNTKTFTRSGDTVVVSSLADVTTVTPYYLYPIKVSSTGTLPSGLSADTVYWCAASSATASRLYPTAADCVAGTNQVTLSSDGTGTHTLTVLNQVNPYGFGPYTAGATGEYDFVAGGGTGSETSCYVAVDKEHMISSTILGPRKDDIDYTTLTSRDYATDCWHDIDAYYAFEDTTGERHGLGYMPSLSWRAWHRQEPASYQAARVHALMHCQYLVHLKRASTFNIVNLTNSTHTGLGTAQPSTQYRPSSNQISGVTAPTLRQRRWSTFTGQHAVFPEVAAYLMWAEPDMADAMMLQSVHPVTSIITRTFTISPTTYYNVVMNSGTPREQAWGLNAAAWMLAMGPQTWNGANMRAYYEEFFNSNANWAAAQLASDGTSFAQTNKAPVDNAEGGRTWMENYLQMVLMTAWVAMGKPSNLRTVLENFYSFYDGVRTNVGLYATAAYTGGYVANGANSRATKMTAWTDFWTEGAFGGIAVNAASDTITYDSGASPVSGYGTIANGDKFAIFSSSGFSIGGLTQNTAYYVRDLDTGAKTFKLSTNAGLSDVVNLTGNETLTDNTRYATRSSPISSDYQSLGSNTPDTVVGKMWASIKMAKANGLTVPAGLVTAFSGVESEMSAAEYGDDAAYALNENY